MLMVNQLVGFGVGGGLVTPDQLSPFAWHRADNVTGSPIVTAWPDLSINGRGLSSVRNAPTLMSSAINGYSAVSFDPASGANVDTLWRATSYNPGTTFSLVAVIRPDSYSSNNRPIFFDNDSSDSTRPMINFNGTNADVRAYDGSVKAATPSGAPGAGNWGVLRGIWKSGSYVKGRWNGGNYTSAALGAFTAVSGLALGSGADAGDHASLDIAEIILFADETSPDLLEDYLIERYALW